MSLISAKNLVAPLTNKVHLMSLVLVAVGFAFLRYSGGSISLEERSQTRNVRSKNVRTINKNAADPTQNSRSRVDELFNSVSPMGKKQKEPKKIKKVPPKRKDSGSLAEIEKSLGM